MRELRAPVVGRPVVGTKTERWGEKERRGTWWGGKQVESRARQHADRTCPAELRGGEEGAASVAPWRGQITTVSRRGGGRRPSPAEGAERERGAEEVAALTPRLTADYHYHYSCLSGATDSYVSERPLRSGILCIRALSLPFADYQRRNSPSSVPILFVPASILCSFPSSSFVKRLPVLIGVNKRVLETKDPAGRYRQRLG